MYFIQNCARNKDHSDIHPYELLNILFIMFQRNDGITSVRRMLGTKM